MDIQLALWVALVAIVVLNKEDVLELILILDLAIRTTFLNAVLFARSYVTYLKIRSAFKSQGLKAPAFVFTPIQERHDG